MDFECTRSIGETWERDGLKVKIMTISSFDADDEKGGTPKDQRVVLEVSTPAGEAGTIEVDYIGDLYEIAQIIMQAVHKNSFLDDICFNEPEEDYE